MDDDRKSPDRSADMEWADVVRNVIHLMHEVVLADLQRLEQLRREMIRRGIDVPPLIDRAHTPDS